MSEFNELAKLIKRAAVEAVETDKPVNICFGAVTSAEPLEINIEQRLQLTKDQLMLCRDVTEYTIEMTVDHTTEPITHSHSCPGEGCGMSSNTHAHVYKGRKKFMVHNGLKVGERVVLLRMQGGQKYLVLDRVMS